MSISQVVGPALTVFALVCLGCSKQEPPKPVSISGKAQYANGKPITGMVLTFHPRDDSNKSNLPIAILEGQDGRFALSCLPGKYKITMVPIPTSAVSMGGVELPPAGPIGKGKDKQQMMLDNYRSPESSPWEITVLPDGNSEVVLTFR